jgi:hypothetical protein
MISDLKHTIATLRLNTNVITVGKGMRFIFTIVSVANASELRSNCAGSERTLD